MSIFGLKLTTFKDQIIQMMDALWSATDFIRNHNLLNGIKKHRWIFVFVIAVAILFSFTWIMDIIGLYNDADVMPDKMEASLEVDYKDTISDKITKGGQKAFFSGGSSFLLLILLEVVIFYFITITAAILTQREIKTSFGAFIAAEWRMIKLMVRNFVKAGILHLILNLGLGIFGLDVLVDIIMFFVYSYYIGFAFFDNFIELYDISKKQGNAIIFNHWAAATFMGVLVSVLLYIPVFGAITAPILAGVGTAIYCYRNAIHKEISIDDMTKSPPVTA